MLKCAKSWPIPASTSLHYFNSLPRYCTSHASVEVSHTPPQDNNVVDQVSNLFLAVCCSRRDFICVSLCSNFALGRHLSLQFVPSHFAILIFGFYTRVLLYSSSSKRKFRKCDNPAQPLTLSLMLTLCFRNCISSPDTTTSKCETVACEISLR